MPLSADPAWNGLAFDFVELLFCELDRMDTIEEWLSAPLHWLSDRFQLQAIQVVEKRGGAWRALASEGNPLIEVADEFLSHTLDTQTMQWNANWIAFPIASVAVANAVFCLTPARPMASASDHSLLKVAESLQHYIDAMNVAMKTWFSLRSLRTEIRHRDRMLEVASDWHNHLSMPALLEQIALAAANLLDADRASIFLWDKAAKQLVGHPALGVQGQPLRLPDDAGVAGNVLRTMKPQRWDRSDPADHVDRRVDAKVGYRTDSLIAVALVDPKGNAMGVFEVLNQAQGRFDQEHEKTLMELAKHASAALANTQRMQQLIRTRDRLTQDAASQVPLIGNCESIQQLRATIQRVAQTDLAILLLGENGTGKEVASRQVHYQSKRRYEPFVAVNCAALAETLLESELFGHEKGAFTDAFDTRIGKFEQAHGGTLLLDEIGDMTLSGQAKLLRVLEEKVVVRVGGSATIPVDVRVIAATNQDLVSMVRSKKFREDLYFRLSVVQLKIPPLRDRREDIVELANHFLESFCLKIGRTNLTFSAESKNRLQQHSWPGNIRELRNLMERLVYLCPNDTIETSDFDFVSSGLATNPDGENASVDLRQPLAQATDDFQIQVIEEHIAAAHGNISLAAQTLGLQRSNLYRKMKQLGMRTPE